MDLLGGKMRKDARKVAFSLIYEYLFTNTYDDLSLEQFTSKTDVDDKVFVLDEADRDFIKGIYGGVVKDIDDYRTKVSALARGFKEERLFKVDLAILMMAVYELDNTDTPIAVIINEAVELGKIYSTENSAGFINGILAEYTKEQHKD